jgi:hypothetical protein
MRRKMRRWAFVGIATAIALVIIVAIVLPSILPGVSNLAATASTTARVEYDTSLPLAEHIDRPEHHDIGQQINYREPLPPDSGNHWNGWANCGIYDYEINDEYVVHNLEHGQVVISYNLPDQEEAGRLRELAEDLGGINEWGIVRPYSKIDEGTVVVTAWGFREQVQGVDEEAIRGFYDEHRRNRYSNETQEVGPIPCVSTVPRSMER